MDRKEQNRSSDSKTLEDSGIFDSGTFLNSAYYAPESILPDQFLTREPDPIESKPVMPKATVTVTAGTGNTNAPRSSGWIGLVASVSVGILFAFILFPAMNYINRTTRSHVAETWMTEINRRVDQYEQIHGSKNDTSLLEELLPVDLALSGWQALHSDTFAPASIICTFEHRIGSDYNANPIEARNTTSLGDLHYIARIHNEDDDALILQFQSENGQERITSDGTAPNILEDMLLLMLGQESLMRSAFGQDVLIKEGRVFFRILPGTE
jgi:type II secretory pathway pseudopilin PulG